MVETIEANSTINENNEHVVYMNTFGIVSNTTFTVYNLSKKIQTNIADTRFVTLQKVRKIKKNAILIGLSVYMIIAIYYLPLSLKYTIVFCSIALILLIVGILFKEYYYKFKIVTGNNDCIEFEVEKKFKEDAKKIQRVVKEKLKKE